MRNVLLSYLIFPQVGMLFFVTHWIYSPDYLHLVAVRGLAGLNDLTGYAGRNFMFLVGLPKPNRP